ncbi:AAA domain-containing ATPase [Chloropicon primus]|uniref:AAA domain-containing ATPase n=4 Tax=Chloropicon primus TaxID=1764295 RepID=A0A5B8MTX3_9CHLO|nr:AAA domain-containing ATPase [Chloropicon primus]UPR02106.1 AAA domain-containing ATPase [Chloropicon primus]|eukprot:QDZ22882.1 AAA domain-containing ATPase [Chloropicon primus]
MDPRWRKGGILVTKLTTWFALGLLFATLPCGRGAIGASAKWTSKYTSLDTEVKSLLLEESMSQLRQLVPTRKSNGLVFGTHCALEAETTAVPAEEGNGTAAPAPVEVEETETGVVLFRVTREDVKGMDVSRATLALHIRRYDLELDQVDFYYLDQTWKSAVSPGTVLENLRAKQSKAFASIDLSLQDRGSWGAHNVDVTQYVQKASQGLKSLGGFLAVGSSKSGSCRARGFMPSSSYSPTEGLPRVQVDYRIDMFPPVGSITEQPPPLTRLSTATLHFAGTDLESGMSHFKCKLDDGEFQDCTSPWTYENLKDGAHSFAMKPVDNSGNEGHVVFSEPWLIDTVLPVAHLVEGHHPPQNSLSQSATFLFHTEDNVVKGGSAQMTTECRLDGMEYFLCYSGAPVTFSDLDQGVHNFYIKVQDAAGNVNELELWTWQVDIPPACSVQVNKSTDRRGHSAFAFTFAWSEEVKGFSPDGVVVGGVGAELKAWRQINETHYQASCEPLTDGDITVQVKSNAAQDMEGNWNIEPSNTARISYDGTPPKCTLKTLHPANTFSGKFSLTIAWSEDVKGFSPDAISILGDSKKVGATFASKFSADTVGSHFTGTIVPFGMGTLSVSVKSKSARDLSGNTNEDSCSLDVTISNTDVYYASQGGSYLSSIGQEALKTFQVVPKNAVSKYKVPGRAGALEVDGQNHLFVAVNNQSIYMYEASKMEAMHTVAQTGKIVGLKTDAHGRLFAAEGESGVIRVFDISESRFELVNEFPISASWNYEDEDVDFISMDFDFTGQLLVLNPFEPKLHIFNAEDFSAVKTVDLKAGTREPLALSVDGKNMVNVLDKASRSVHKYGKGFTKVSETLVLEGCDGLEPKRMSIDSYQNLHVVDASKSNICVVDTKLQEAWLVSIEGSGEIFASSSFHQSQPPTCTILTPPDNQHADFNVTFKWDRPVEGFEVEDINLGGSGGTIRDLRPLGGEGVASEFTASVTAGGIGIVSFQIKPFAVQDENGIWNPTPSEVSKTSFFGGQCSVELGCQWQLAQYQSQLALDRVQKEVEMELEKEEKAAQIREEARIRAETAIETAKMEIEKGKIILEKEVIRARIQAEADERIREARMTEDIRLREIREKGAEYTKTALEVVNTVLNSMHSVLENPEQMKRIIWTLFAFFMAYFISKEAIQVVAKYISKLLGKPSLLRDTTRGSIASLFSFLVRAQKAETVSRQAMFRGIVLCKDLLNQMEIVANSIICRKQNDLPYRHILFHGMPGTGKTMVAERLAKQCGVDYAIMSGGDVIPLGKSAVTELHRLFNWAERSSKGVLIFIDEAEAFLQKRTSGVQQSEHMKSAINALLSRTGQPTRKFMLVLATNRPQDLDSAVLDRIDDSIAFPLPGDKERMELLDLYFTNYIGAISKDKEDSSGGQILGWTMATVQRNRGFLMNQLCALFPSVSPPKIIKLVGFPNGETFKTLSKMTSGFSGREVSKLISSVGTYAISMDGKGGSSLSWKECVAVVEQKAKEHAVKRSFYA